MKTVGVTQSDAVKLRQNHMMLRRGVAGRGSFHRQSEGTGGTGRYYGYFRAIDTTVVEGETATSKVKIVDGSSDDFTAETYAGPAQIASSDFEVDAAELTIEAEAYIYLESTYNESTELPNTPTFEQYAEKQSYAAGVTRVLLAVVKWNAETGRISSIIQQHHGAIYAQLYGEC